MGSSRKEIVFGDASAVRAFRSPDFTLLIRDGFFEAEYESLAISFHDMISARRISNIIGGSGRGMSFGVCSDFERASVRERSQLNKLSIFDRVEREALCLVREVRASRIRSSIFSAENSELIPAETCLRSPLRNT